MESINNTNEEMFGMNCEIPNEAAIIQVVKSGCHLLQEFCKLTKDEHTLHYHRNNAVNAIISATATAVLELAEVFNSDRRRFEICSQIGIYSEEEEKYFEEETTAAIISLIVRYIKEDQFSRLYNLNADR